MPIKKLLNRFRRNIGKTFNKDYINQKLQKRHGNCKKCGNCCKECEYLSYSNLCTVYLNRPYFCHKEFPIDKLDQDIFQVKNCGYYFKK